MMVNHSPVDTFKPWECPKGLFFKKDKCKYYRCSNAGSETENKLPETDQKITAVLMDDESYFSCKHDQMPVNVGFCTINKENTPPNIKYSPKTKFPKKMLAISEAGPFFVPNKGNINGEVYRREWGASPRWYLHLLARCSECSISSNPGSLSREKY